MNFRFAQHDRSMKLFYTIFWIMFTVVALMIATVWCLVGVGAYKTLKCMGDQQCLEQQGHKVGSFRSGSRSRAQL